MKIKFFVNIVNFEKTLKNRVDIKLQSEYNISIINEKQTNKSFDGDKNVRWLITESR